MLTVTDELLTVGLDNARFSVSDLDSDDTYQTKRIIESKSAQEVMQGESERLQEAF